MIDMRNVLHIECPRAVGAYLDTVPAEVWDGGWVLDRKIDGERDTLQIGSEGSLLVGRNKRNFLKGVAKAGAFMNHNFLNPKIGALAYPDLDGTILDGELTELYNQDGTLDEDTKQRMKIGEFIGYVTWGVLYVKGQDVRSWREDKRYEAASILVGYLKDLIPIKLVQRVPATRENLKIFLEDPTCEGAIAKKISVGLPPASRANRFWQKIKADSRRTVDAFIIGVQESKSGGSGLTGVKPQPDGMAATFTVAIMKDGNPVEVGKVFGFDAIDKFAGFKQFDRYKDRVCEFQVSGWNGKYFRFPKFVRWRPDKTPEDCKWEEQVGG